MKNKQLLSILENLTPTNFNLALTIAEGLGLFEEVLEWWWEERSRKYYAQDVGDVLCFAEPLIEIHKGYKCSLIFAPVEIEKLNEYWERDIFIRYFPTDKYEDCILYAFNFQDLPPLPTIIQTIKDYNFALIRHLWENGEIE